MAVIATVSKTILDITDGAPLSVYLASNLPRTQVHDINSGVYQPNWASSPLVITPSVYLDQNPVALSDSKLSFAWKRRDGSGSEVDLVAGESVSGGVLTVNQNKLGDAASGIITYVLRVSYNNTTTGVTSAATAESGYSLVKTGSNSKLVSITGDQAFRIAADGSVTPASITLTATLQNVTINKWQYKNSSGNWVDYPAGTITGNTLTVSPSHNVFNNNVANLRVLTSDHAIYDTISIYKVSDGNGIKSTEIAYGKSSSPSVTPQDWSGTIPSIDEGEYLWTRTTIKYVNSSVEDTVTYTFSRQGVDGATGTSVTVSSIQYQKGTSATVQPTGTWENNPVSVGPGEYLWTKTTYSDGHIAYTVARSGTNGIDGIDGTDGVDGNDASTVLLTNENITFAADKDGKVAGTTRTCNVVAYTGTTKVTPSVGTITGAPTGMTITKGNVTRNEIPITITIADDATLGGAGEQSGTLNIPITSPVSTTLTIRWSKVNTGATGADGADGADAVLLTVYAPQGNVFSNGKADGQTHLDLNATFMIGANDCTQNADSLFAWYKYNGSQWTQVQAETAGSSGGYSYTVNASEVVTSAVYRCRARKSGSSSYYYDTITVIDKTDNFQSVIESTAGDIFRNAIGDTVMDCRVWQNAQEVDGLKSTTYSTDPPDSPTAGTFYYQIQSSGAATKLMRYNGSSWVDVTNNATYKHTLTYVWTRCNIDGEPIDTTDPFATGKVIHVTDADVDGKTTFFCHVYDGSTLVSMAQFSIRDDNDITVSDTAPTSPVMNQLWLDTSVTPNVLKKYTGSDSGWTIINDTAVINTSIVEAEERMNTALNNAVAGINSTIDQKIAEMQLTDEQFTIMFGRTVATGVQNSIDDVQGNLTQYQTDVANYMRYNSDGVLTLGKQGSSFMAQLTNTRMSFLEANAEVAYISNQSMYITQARITDTLSLGTNNGYGYFDWTVTPTGLGLKWRDPVSLRITQTFEGDLTSETIRQRLAYTITGKDVGGSNINTLDITYGDFQNGTYSIANLPEGETYTITQTNAETLDAGYELDASSSIITGTMVIPHSGIAAVALKNVYTSV